MPIFLLVVLSILALCACYEKDYEKFALEGIMENFSLEEKADLVALESALLFTESVEKGESSAVFDDALPPLWLDVKPLLSFPRDKTSHRILVDPWDYMQRMALYKYLIENIHHCAWSKAGDISRLDLGNIIWGLPLQHGWQYSSGRLLVEPNSTYMNPKSWWADMNYYLSVIPYFGAVKAGVAPDIEISSINPDPTNFCDSVLSCDSSAFDVVEPWREFFQYVHDTKDDCAKEGDKQSSPALSVPTALSLPLPIFENMDFNLSSTMERLLQSLWNAHLHSIDFALPRFNDQLAALSSQEALFGKSWSGLVDLIAMSYFPCNFSTTNLLQHALPHRLLQEDDRAPVIKDFSRFENRAVLLIDGIFQVNQRTTGGVDRVWQKMMCKEEGRALGRKLITLGIYRLRTLVQCTVELFSLLRHTGRNETCGITL